MSNTTELSPIWNIPYRRNEYFTGRDEVLARLYNSLHADNTAAITPAHGLSGLGGIGKTQTAVEYAYQYRHDYHAIFWARADSFTSIVSDFVAMASLLNLPEKDEQDQSLIVDAVMHWLQHHAGWLLILDNADDLALVEPFLPKAGQGHILLTTRAWALERRHAR